MESCGKIIGMGKKNCRQSISLEVYSWENDQGGIFQPWWQRLSVIPMGLPPKGWWLTDSVQARRLTAQNFGRTFWTFAIELRDLDHGSWIIQIYQIWISMGHSLSLLHALGKFNRNYLPASVFTMFSVFLASLFRFKENASYLKWRTGLKWWSWTTTIKEAMCLRLQIRLPQNECETLCKVF